MNNLEFSVDNDMVVVTDREKEKVIAKISYHREITFIPEVTLPLDTVKAIEDFARYDNLCISLDRPHEKALKPVTPELKKWEAIKLFINSATYHNVLSYEYDENNGDIYVQCCKKYSQRLCHILTANGIRHSLQTNQQLYCTIIYSNLINQIEQLNEYLERNTNILNYQTVRVTFKESLSKTDLMFSDTDAWGVASIKEWIDCYESSRFTSISDSEAIITSEYNMEFIREWLNKQGIVASIEDLN